MALAQHSAGAARPYEGRIRGPQTLVDGQGECLSSHSGYDERYCFRHRDPPLSSAGHTGGLRNAEVWEKVGVLYNGHGKEIPGDASTLKTLMVTQTETSLGATIILGS